jgi:hypothetical protein
MTLTLMHRSAVSGRRLLDFSRFRFLGQIQFNATCTTEILAACSPKPEILKKLGFSLKPEFLQTQTPLLTPAKFIPALALAIEIAATRAKSAVADSEVVEGEPATAGFVFLAAVSTARVQPWRLKSRLSKQSPPRRTQRWLKVNLRRGGVLLSAVSTARVQPLNLAIEIAATRAKSAVADSEVVEGEPATAGFVFLAAVSTARLQPWRLKSRLPEPSPPSRTQR